MGEPMHRLLVLPSFSFGLTLPSTHFAILLLLFLFRLIRPVGSALFFSLSKLISNVGVARIMLGFFVMLPAASSCLYIFLFHFTSEFPSLLTVSDTIAISVVCAIWIFL